VKNWYTLSSQCFYKLASHFAFQFQLQVLGKK